MKTKSRDIPVKVLAIKLLTNLTICEWSSMFIQHAEKEERKECGMQESLHEEVFEKRSIVAAKRSEWRVIQARWAKRC
jgi:hypothetical protein